MGTEREKERERIGHCSVDLGFKFVMLSFDFRIKRHNHTTISPHNDKKKKKNGWLLYSANLPVKKTQCASTHHSRKYTHRHKHNLPLHTHTHIMVCLDDNDINNNNNNNNKTRKLGHPTTQWK